MTRFISLFTFDSMVIDDFWAFTDVCDGLIVYYQAVCFFKDFFKLLFLFDEKV